MTDIPVDLSQMTPANFQRIHDALPEVQAQLNCPWCKHIAELRRLLRRMETEMDLLRVLPAWGKRDRIDCHIDPSLEWIGCALKRLEREECTHDDSLRA